MPKPSRASATLLGGVAELGHRIDTSDLQPKVLRNWIRDLLGLDGGSLTLLFESFAYRDGIPLDADWVIDVRMLPNPHYDPALRPLTGRDAAVVAFLDGQEQVQRLREDVRTFLARWLPEVVQGQPQLPHRRHRLHRRPAPLGVPRREARARPSATNGACWCATAASPKSERSASRRDPALPAADGAVPRRTAAAAHLRAALHGDG